MGGPVQVSLGLGTNSVAAIVGMVERGERIDVILAADTGGEKPHTYAYIPIFKRWLAGFGLTLTMVQAVNRRQEPITLEGDCRRRDTLPALAFGFKTCSHRFKQEPQKKYVNNWRMARDAWNRGEKVTRIIGYDAGPRDVKRRIGADEKLKGSDEADKFENRYPLQEWGWDREACRAAIVDAGLPLPGKSACYYCPASTYHDIALLGKNYPDLLEDALDLERRAMPNLRGCKGLGRRFNWGEFVASPQFAILKNEVTDDDVDGDDVPCGCYDG